MDCRQVSQAHTLCVYEATLLEVVQNEAWHFAPFSDNSLDALSHSLRMCVLSFCPSEMSSCPENLAVFLHRVDIWLPPCVIQFQVIFVAAAVDCVE